MKQLYRSLSTVAVSLAAMTGAHAATLSDLLGGGSVVAGDLLFDQWSVQAAQTSDPGFTFDYSQIDADPAIDGGVDPVHGLDFSVQADHFEVLGNGSYAFKQLEFSYRVSSLNPFKQVSGSSLSLIGWSLGVGIDVANDTGVSVSQGVGSAFGLADLDIGGVSTSVLDDQTMGSLLWQAPMAAGSERFVGNALIAWSVELHNTANLMNFSQRFSQNTLPVPEPASALLLGAGLLGLMASRRGKGASRS